MLRMFIRHMASAPQRKRPPISMFGLEGRYVNALYSAASQTSQLEQVEQNLRAIQKEITKPKIVDFIESSMISRAGKAKLLMDIAKEAGMPSSTVNFLGIVAENGRLKKLNRMVNMFLEVMVAHRNEAPCRVVTAEPLDDVTRKTLMDVLKKFVKQGKNIQLTETVDPSIIGGIAVSIEDKYIDMSIARKVKVYTDLLKESV